MYRGFCAQMARQGRQNLYRLDKRDIMLDILFKGGELMGCCGCTEEKNEKKKKKCYDKERVNE